MTTIRTALISSAVDASIWWADHSGNAKAIRYIAFHISSNNNIGNICTGYRSPNAAVPPRPASRAYRTPCVAANPFVWWTTAGQIYTPSPTAIRRYAARSAYRRNSETSGMVASGVMSPDGTCDPASEFMVTHSRHRFLGCGRSMSTSKRAFAAIGYYCLRSATHLYSSFIGLSACGSAASAAERSEAAAAAG